MVAETTALPSPPKPKGKRGGFHQPIPLPTKLKIRALYLIQQLSFNDIATQTGLTSRQVQNLVFRERWTPIRQRIRSAAEAKASQRTQERIEEEISELGESVAIQTADLSVGTLAKARATLDRDDKEAARDLQAYSQSAKNFVGIYRQVRELDKQQANDRSNGATIIFIGALERVGDSKRSEIRVTEIQAMPIPAIPDAAPPDKPSV